MRTKGICLVCRGTGKVIDRVTKQHRSCVACNSSGYIPVREVAIVRPQASFNVAEVNNRWYPKKEKHVSVRPEKRETVKDLTPKEYPNAWPEIKVAVLKFQEIYFATRNIMDLKPMALKDITAITNISEGCICRHTNKTIHNIIIKSLFQPSISGVARPAILKLMEDQLAKEKLSDYQLMEAMKRVFNITIARRTVTKYRMMLGIESNFKFKHI